jgi:maleylacetate reductase
MHTPVAVTEKALGVAMELGADVVISLGGGSTTGLGKAIALRTGLPQIAIPTSYAGSEATPILGETRDGRKITQRAPAILPDVVIYDVDLTLTLPPGLTVTSGLNAIAHAIEALYAENRNPLISQLAISGIEALVRALPAIVSDPADATARSDALYGAWACGTCLGSVGMALHHKVCHVLGGSFDLPHAETHSVILPHAVAYNEASAHAQLQPVANLLGAQSAATGLWDLARALGAPIALKDIGMPEAGLDKAAAEVTANPYWNPRPVAPAPIRAMLADAFNGTRPVLEN